MGESTLRCEDFNQTNLRPVADRLLEWTNVECVDEGVLLVMNPPGFEHREIVSGIVGSFCRAFMGGLTSVDWSVHSNNFQWDLPGSRQRFYVPDVAVVHPDVQTLEEERAAIALLAEVTSPRSSVTVFNDRETKPREYAQAGVPLYLLVDQERREWTLFGLAEGWQRYQVAAGGKYGEQIPLPVPFGFAVETGDWPRYRD